jgi:pSer/pThr/pTyr-binding forkhead associated (FHA) protein
MSSAKLYKLGRLPDCEIVLDHITISRVHAEFFVDPESNVFLSDLNSSYGTFVNAIRIAQPVLLVSGDIVSFGDEQFFDWEYQLLGTDLRTNPFEKEVKKEFSLIPFLNEYKDVLIIYIAIVILFFVLHLQTN